MKGTRSFIIAALFSFVLIGCSDDDPTDPPVATDPPEYINANAAIGGISYDKFWSSEAGFDQNDPNIAVISASSDFFRCKQCHAWDLLGSNGSYISRGPKTTRPHVSSLNLFTYVQSKTPQELFDGMKKTANRRDISHDLSDYDPEMNSTVGDQMPNLNQILTDAQIWDMVKFMKTGAFDVSQLYDAEYAGSYSTGSATFTNVGKDGNATDGAAHFKLNCESCHGEKGDNFYMENMTVGEFTRNKPNEVQHKVKYGQLGSAMAGDFDITVEQMKDLYKALSDPVAFPDK